MTPYSSQKMKNHFVLKISNMETSKQFLFRNHERSVVYSICLFNIELKFFKADKQKRQGNDTIFKSENRDETFKYINFKTFFCFGFMRGRMFNLVSYSIWLFHLDLKFINADS